MLRNVDELTQNEYQGLREWFANELQRLDGDAELAEPHAPPKFRTESLSRTCVYMFNTFFSSANEAISLPYAEEADSNADTVLPAEAPVETRPPAPKPKLTVVDHVPPDDVVESVVSGALRQELHMESDRILSEMEQLIGQEGLVGFAWDDHRESRDERAIVIRDLPHDSNVWFIGDVHGDLLGLHCALQYIEQFEAEHPPTIIFLGDLFDDGEYSFEVMLRLFQLILKEPARVCVIAGNHDESLRITDGGFTCSVWPSNFTDWLNDHAADDESARRLGQLTVDFFQQAPRAIYLPDGLLVTHGGVPHSDVLETIESVSDLNSDACQVDYVWTRIHERARRRIPNRTTRGCELGREDFEDFCKKASAILEQPVRRIIRGHDHLDTKDRYALFERYKENAVLTINNMCCRLDREVFGPYERTACIARWRWGEIPEVHRIQVPEDAVRRMYPQESPSDASAVDEDAEEVAANKSVAEDQPVAEAPSHGQHEGEPEEGQRD